MWTNWKTHWEKNYNSFMWKTWVWRLKRAYKKMLENVDLNNPKILELGSGSGTNSLFLAKSFGARKVTLVDFNKNSLEMCKRSFKGSDFDVEFLQENVLGLKMEEKFDLVHSEGLIEHFFGGSRRLAFKKHVDFCKKGGFVIIFVPYKSLQYDVFKWFFTKVGCWIWNERVFSKEELYELCKLFSLKILKEYTSPFIHQVGILANKRNKN